MPDADSTSKRDGRALAAAAPVRAGHGWDHAEDDPDRERSSDLDEEGFDDYDELEEEELEEEEAEDYD
jgi:hypothetical protein